MRRAWRRDARRLPGTLADETPRPPEAGKWQPRREYAPGSLADQLQHELAELLLERDAETQRADRAEARLRAAEARIRGLEATVTAYATQALTDTAEMPRRRSDPAPGRPEARE